ncbi:VanZ family protein [Evansella sp. AB-P1]|uniref:VanZ family protein n=1 Tax=Evansella sp. AB-P1 TaxID=3037653 RepID=UPI00241D103A|nr:VanZ family protein [Evansella sp. AB-P1]MDG5786081.1 VanZ family protein [Evansella sp. AB-P1]
MYIIDLSLIGFYLLVIYIIVDFIRKRTENLGKRIVLYTFIFYVANVLQLTTGGIAIPQSIIDNVVRIQPIPFYFVLDLLNHYERSGLDWHFWNALQHSFHNFIMLLPLGIYLPVLFQTKSLKKVTIIIFLSSLTIETYQLILSYLNVLWIGRTFNVDDLILNTAGGVVGLLIYLAGEKALKRIEVHN